ncbi:calmodulin-like [Watersipora subatra]|uniref:calmodulin-like n=1 Tax=Watersipora subatra TaxID=2589382 RepID=UPI00355B7752
MAKVELSGDSKKALYECFKYYDTSGDGVIDKEELPDALRFAGIDPSETDLDKIIKLFDSNGDGKLQIEELVENWDALCQHSVNGKQLMDAFNKLDLDGDGYIKLDELVYILRNTGEKMSLKEAWEFARTMKQFDKNGDGKFAYPEFVAMWSADAFPMPVSE